MRGLWFVALVTGCGFKANSTPIDASTTDSVDAMDAAGTMTCPWPYTPSGFDPCMGVPTETLPDLDLSAPGVYLYDTDDGTLTPPASATDLMVPTTGSGGARVIWTKSFRIGAGTTLRAIGDLPLVVVSQGHVTIEGTLDVGSYLNPSVSIGAGSDPTSCDATRAQGGRQCTHGGSGGGGGGFGTAGMAGGTGGLTHDCGFGANAGTAGGTGGQATTDLTFRGGCDGGEGAEGDGSTAGDNGVGGGAIHLIARDVLRIGSLGKVLAGGGGGGGGNNGRSGGGGGGSGGLILLAGTTILVDAGGVLAANGGGGGGGSDNGLAGPGGDGQPAAIASNGGASEGMGGKGGNGATGNTGATVGLAVSRGGGGGGGGAGKIRLTTKPGNAPVTTGAVISPAPI